MGLRVPILTRFEPRSAWKAAKRERARVRLCRRRRSTHITLPSRSKLTKAQKREWIDRLVAEAKQLPTSCLVVTAEEARFARALARLSAMTPQEVFQSSVDAGIHNPDGSLTEHYRPKEGS